MATVFSVASTGFSEVIRTIRQMEAEVMRETQKIFRAHLREGVNYGRAHYLTGGTGTTSRKLAVRSGNLRNAFWYEVKDIGHDIEGRLGFIRSSAGGRAQANPLVYAWIHHRGGAVRAKPGGYLTIPLPEALTPAGVLRSRARDWPDTFVRRSRQGRLIIFQKRGKQIVPLFVLKTYVVIPKRSTLDPTWNYVRPRLMADLRSGKLVQRFQ